MSRYVILLLLLAVVGCESSEEKAERLRSDLAIKSLTVLMYRQRADSIKATNPRNRADSTPLIFALDSMFKAEASRDAAEREWNRYMSGR